MKKLIRVSAYKLLVVLILPVSLGAVLYRQPPQEAGTDVLAQLREIPTATLADVVDEVVGKPGFMNYDMRPVAAEKRIAGRARTVLLAPPTQAAPEQSLGVPHTIQAIDESGPGDVLVIVNGDLNIAAFGGLMATTAKVRQIEGVIIDGAVRDVEQIRELRLPLFSRSISPATSVGRQFTLNRNVPVVCGGITVHPGDYIVADQDGVVRIPAQHMEAVLRQALEFEETERKMIPQIMKLKSLGKVIEMFGRI